MALASNLNKRQFLAVGNKDSGHEGKPNYVPGSATAYKHEERKCNIHVGNEALDKEHTKVCNQH